jgi:hypothetical protein
MGTVLPDPSPPKRERQRSAITSDLNSSGIYPIEAGHSPKATVVNCSSAHAGEVAEWPNAAVC